MGEIVNLRMKRKERSRADKERLAEENRQRYGRTKAERQLEEQRKVLDERRLDGHALSLSEKLGQKSGEKPDSSENR